MKGTPLYNGLRDLILGQSDKAVVLIGWLQGESDCANGLHATYGARMLQMATDLNVDTARHLYWADCQLSSQMQLAGSTPETRQAVRDGKNFFAATHPRVLQVSPEGATLGGDNLHYTMDGLLTMADRIWSAGHQLGLF